MTKDERRALFRAQKAKTEAYWAHVFKSKDGKINWLGPNLWTGFTAAVAMIIALTPRSDTYLGFISNAYAMSIIGYFFAVMTRRIAWSYGAAIDSLEPSSALEAKRANEQIKLTANLINAAAGAIVSIYVVTQFLKDKEPSYASIVIGAGLAVWVHSAARDLLGRLKDEAVTSPPSPSQP